jgi:putative transposase
MASFKWFYDGNISKTKTRILISIEYISQLKEGVKECIEFYNFRTFHQSLIYKKPMELYLKIANEKFPCAA